MSDLTSMKKNIICLIDIKMQQAYGGAGAAGAGVSRGGGG